jgi:hypothetical protein
MADQFFSVSLEQVNLGLASQWEKILQGEIVDRAKLLVDHAKEVYPEDLGNLKRSWSLDFVIGDEVNIEVTANSYVRWLEFGFTKEQFDEYFSEADPELLADWFKRRVPSRDRKGVSDVQAWAENKALTLMEKWSKFGRAPGKPGGYLGLERQSFEDLWWDL